jgi:hypothetical protein
MHLKFYASFILSDLINGVNKSTINDNFNYIILNIYFFHRKGYKPKISCSAGSELSFNRAQ